MRLLYAVVLAMLAAAVPAHAQAPAFPQQASHPNGATLLVRSVTMHPDGVLVSLSVINGSSREIQLNHQRSMKLVDGQTVFNLNAPPDNPTLRIPPAGRLSGDFLFLGILRPGAQTLALTMNDGVGGSESNPYDSLPILRLNLPVAAAPAAGTQATLPPALPAPQAATPDAGQPGPGALVQASHRNGSSLVVTSVTARVDSIMVALDALNGSANEIRLNHQRSLVLKDDRGTTYRLNPPAGNEALAIPAGNRLQAQLVFIGRLPPGATQLVLSCNEGVGGSEDEYARLPIFKVSLPVPATVTDAVPGAGLRDSTAATVAIAASTAAIRAAGTGAAMAGLIAQPSATVAATAGSRATVEQLRAQLGAVDTSEGTRITLSGDVLFDFDRDSIRPDAQPVLARVGSLIRETRPTAVQVEGHTDSRGSDSYNQGLSERRARSVAAWLGRETAGVPTRFTERGFGEARPVAANGHPDGRDDPQGRQRNRRVEILLLRG